MWAPDVIYNKKMGKYVMYFCTTSSYVKSNICFATADDIEGPYHYEDTFLYSGYSYHDVKESNIEELMGTDPRPYTAASYDNNNWPNCIDPDVFYDEDGRMWMVYGSWSGGIFLIEIDEETGYPIYPEADEEKFVAAGKKYNIIMVKGSAFGCGGFVRLAYCVSHETVKNSLPAFAKLAAAYGLSAK